MNTIKRITSTDLANATAETLNEVFYGRRPVVVTRRKKDLVVIVDVETWEEITHALPENTNPKD